MKNFRTDIVKEEIDDLKIKGVKKYQKEIDGFLIEKIYLEKNHKLNIKKNPGTYITIDLNHQDIHDDNIKEKIVFTFSKELVEFLKEEKLLNKRVMIIGLGNNNVTPDSIGPKTIQKIIVTRHLFENNIIHKGYTNVCAYSPGVMGNTGIESFDIIKAIAYKVEVDYLIVIDALASSSINNLNNTIQITNAGIIPGSGVGNRRAKIDYETINKKVIVIGVPTVVDIETIISELSINKINNIEHKMMVTPKDIDFVVEDISSIIANTLDLVLHPKNRAYYLNGDNYENSTNSTS